MANDELVPLSRVQHCSAPCDASRRSFCAAAGAGLMVLALPACDDGLTRITTGGVDEPPGVVPPDTTPDLGNQNTNGTTGNTNGTTGTSGNTNGTTGTSGTNNGTTGTSGTTNGTTGTTNGTTGTTGTTNGTTGTTNGTTGTSGGTTGGATCSGSVMGGAASAIPINSALRKKVSRSVDIWICHDNQGYYALDNHCTHRDCALTFESDQTFYCGCHGAQFDFNGENPTSPAYSPLSHFAVCIDGSGNITVDTSKTVSASTRVS